VTTAVTVSQRGSRFDVKYAHAVGDTPGMVVFQGDN
jgi:hypothetical protein